MVAVAAVVVGAAVVVRADVVVGAGGVVDEAEVDADVPDPPHAAVNKPRTAIVAITRGALCIAPRL